jgi:hypothetical protein
MALVFLCFRITCSMTLEVCVGQAGDSGGQERGKGSTGASHTSPHLPSQQAYKGVALFPLYK